MTKRSARERKKNARWGTELLLAKLTKRTSWMLHDDVENIEGNHL